MDYGFFDDATREYVITTPRTPAKWINYVGTLSFGGFVDSTGGGILCKGDPSLNRIVKYIAQMPASDFKGQTLYARFRTAGARQGSPYEIVSPFYVPTLRDWEKWECRIGLGYTRFVTRFLGLDFDIKIFVPLGQTREIRDYRVTNATGAAIELDLVPVVEYTHYDALKQLTNADWVPQTMQSWALRDEGGRTTLAQAAFMRRGVAENFLSSSAAASSFETDRKRFLGANEYGTWARPLALESEELGNYEARRGENIGALLHRMGTVAPGASVRLATQLGQVPCVAQAAAEIEAWRDFGTIDAAFADLASFWKDYLGAFEVASPVPSFDSMINVHNPRQCFVTKNWSRYLSLYQLGFGADRGIGFRDSSQDVMGVMAHMPAEARALIEKLLSVQRHGGSAMHQFNPLTMEASAGDSREYPERPHYYSDDHLWIVLAVCAYLKETGDLSFLAKDLPFYDEGRTAVSGASSDGRRSAGAPVLEHLARSVAFTRGDLGKHGLPLAGFADWNDTVNLESGAESLFTANLYGAALLELSALADELGDADCAARWRAWHAEMKATVNEVGWDGEWWLRYFDAEGRPIGGRESDKARIWINSQTWSVISRFADADRARSCLDSTFRHLNTARGLKLSWPGYDGYDPAKGGVTTYPPGAKENGGIFLHANPWAVIAECMAGNGDRAWRYYQQINPAARNADLDTFEVEPYVYPQNVLGDEHPQFGLGRNSWLSGTASWAYQAATQRILGVRADYRALVLDPCVPGSWKAFRVVRRFRGAVYDIEVANPRGSGRRVVRATLDGADVPSGSIAGGVLRIPVFTDGGRHAVTAVLE
ncbi:MAG: glycosyl transferase [Spirochaetaceae bacterium]|nr:glycosyl transferase [Spirochaetaceae bacterium]